MDRYWSGEEVESKGQWKRDCTWPETVGGALFVKPGAIIPMGPVTAFVDQEPLEIVTLDVYPHGRSEFTLYEDDGATYAYENGAWATTKFCCREQPDRVRINIGRRQGTYTGMPNNRGYLLTVHCPTEPARVLRGDTQLGRHRSKEDLVADGAASGWAYDRQKRIVWIKPAAGWYYAADARGESDPERDTVHWVDPEKHEEGTCSLSLELP
jgi:hypothetical protein